jgi:hypothetical protein
VHETCPASIADLTQQLGQTTEAICNDLLQRVMASVPGRLQEWIGDDRSDGAHPRNVIFKRRCSQLIVH